MKMKEGPEKTPTTIPNFSQVEEALAEIDEVTANEHANEEKDFKNVEALCATICQARNLSPDKVVAVTKDLGRLTEQLGERQRKLDAENDKHYVGLMMLRIGETIAEVMQKNAPSTREKGYKLPQNAADASE